MRTVTKTFRVNSEYDEILLDKVGKQDLGVSSLLNQIIHQYVLVTRFAEKVPTRAPTIDPVAINIRS